MTRLTEQEVRAAIANILVPGQDLELGTSGWITDLNINDNQVHIHLCPEYYFENIKNNFIQSITQRIKSKFSENIDVGINYTPTIKSRVVQSGITPHPKIKNIIAVASGKGGVGKSTVSVNLARGLQHQGARVGIIDADVYGPSIPTLLGKQDQSHIKSDEGKLIPCVAEGIEFISLGLLSDSETPVMWRGPMVSRAVQQFIDDTLWSELDYLILDLPPGTGDIQITLAQKVPLTGVVIVSTPQDLSFIDAQKAYAMFKKLNIKVLGMVENMSYHECLNCGHQSHLFGNQAGDLFLDKYGLDTLARIPLNLQLRELSDAGSSVMKLTTKDNNISDIFLNLALAVGVRLAKLKRDYSKPVANLLIKN